jgi:DNA-directed RNA polymerase subunit omega
MLYPTLDSLTKKVGNRYLLVNITAKRAREIAEKAANEGTKLTDKPVRLAVMEIYNGKYPLKAAEEGKTNTEKHE